MKKERPTARTNISATKIVMEMLASSIIFFDLAAREETLLGPYPVSSVVRDPQHADFLVGQSSS